ncbi:MFS transporter, ENTS family, enterobactin (siderophore) exporter [Prauserella marina]|uniref:MFS transporter, ENTS family, enterobactin (Siderophore) exporter n=1 Tax=Prauserella marina TaxID=530584 RepID=A0A1G6XDC7_9PSEU|nr:enterobactin transporter EntS [Prauserella marina]PWV72601.1 ENTS family enterobactin (siderophore) exporter [Prauserella marina]SDD76244.1 MFS transporter, ENTS family, enterobactin (siderophore) exporter [Prauserella marina]
MRLGRLLIDLSPLRQSPGFRVVFAARTVSLLGLGLAQVALPFQVYQLTGSSAQVGLVSLAMAVSLLVGTLTGGVLADRIDRRKLIVRARTLAIVAGAVLLGNALMPVPSLWALYVADVVNGFAGGLSSTVLMAVSPALVGRKHLAAAGALMTLTTQVGAIVGPALGGVLIAGPGLGTTYACTLVALVATALLLRLLPSLPPGGEPGEERQHPLRAMGEGLRYVVRTKVVLGLMVIDLFPMLLAMPYALFPAVGAERFGDDPAAVGLLYTAPAIGAMLAALTSGWTGRVRRPGWVLSASVLVWGMAIVGFGLSTPMWLVVGFLAIAGFGDSVSEILRRALLQAHTPDHLQGRVSALWLSQATVGPSAGNAVSGFAGRLLGTSVALVGGGALCAAGAIGSALGMRGLREAKLTGPEPSPESTERATEG